MSSVRDIAAKFDSVLKFEKNEPVYIRNIDAIRPWQHVLEPLRGYLTLIEKLYVKGAEYSEAWNFGPNDEDVKHVGDIVREMVVLWGRNAKWKINSEDHPHEATYLKLDISKARRRLNWHPTICLSDALKLVVDWYNMYYKNCDMRNYSLGQISAYQKLIKFE
jgi:CDP-glucose 4,6-dehydratase